MLFPDSFHNEVRTRLIMDTPRQGEDLPAVVGVLATDCIHNADAVNTAGGADSAYDYVLAPPNRPYVAASILAEHWRNDYLTPGIIGMRLSAGNNSQGWSPHFTVRDYQHSQTALRIVAQDLEAGLEVTQEVESLTGGALILRNTLTNIGDSDYLVEALHVSIPVEQQLTQVLSFAGRHERERQPQWQPIAEGAIAHTGRRGRPGFGAGPLIAAQSGASFQHGRCLAVHVAWNGNAALAIERASEGYTRIYAGETLLPGEITLSPQESYSTPWIVVVAGEHGLDSVMTPLHTWQRSLQKHPTVQPVVFNSWESVYMCQDRATLDELVRIAARIGVERFVLDDGWFHARYDDNAGLGDWVVDKQTWPKGLRDFSDFVHAHHMQFGLWFEPEMINPDSDAFRAHPEWALAARQELPLLHRHQLVLDLTNPEAYQHVLDQMTQVLTDARVDYVKWDHNRELLDAGSPVHQYAPAIHEQTLAYQRLLHDLAVRLPDIEWESCASGGGRVDLDTVQRVSRFWTSDMTDALSRQEIQCWTSQILAPEYMGAHVSANTSHQTARTYSVDFRAATAALYAFGVEWDLLKADESERETLAWWIQWYKEHRQFLHSQRYMRLDVPDPAVRAYAVVAEDGSRAIVEHVQMDESRHNAGCYLTVDGLNDDAMYELRWIKDFSDTARADDPLNPEGPIGAMRASGRQLARIGVRIPRCHPQTARLFEVNAIR